MGDPTHVKFRQFDETYTAELDVESQKITWNTGDNWTRFNPEAVQGRDEEFVISIVKQGRNIGFDYKSYEPCLVVKEIHKGGVMEAWNRNHASASLECGDR